MEQTAQQVVVLSTGLGAWPQIVAVGLQIVAISVAAWIAYVSLRAAFQADICKAEEITRKLTVRGNEANRGAVGMEKYMDAYIEWYTSPSVLFFLGETHRRVHHDLGGSEIFNLVRLGGYEAKISRDQKTKLNEMRQALNASIRNAHNWGKGKFSHWLFHRKRPVELDISSS